MVRPSLEEVSFSPSLILALGSLSPSFLDWSLLLSAGFSAVADAEAEAGADVSWAKAWGAEMAVAVAVATASAIAIARLRIISP